MKINTLATSVFGLAVGAYAVYGLATDTGPAGWINAVQQMVFGRYMTKLTVVLLTGLALLVVMLFWQLMHRLRPEDSSPEVLRASLAAPAGAAPWRVLIGWMLALIAATWAIAWGLYAWGQHTRQQDAEASYQPLVLRAGAQAPTPSGQHIALQGKPLLDRVLSHKGGAQSSYHLVPYVAEDWRPGQPVRFIVKVSALEELQGLRPRYRPPGTAAAADANAPLLGRVSTDIPAPAIAPFKSAGVVLDAPSYLVQVVPSRDGRAVAAREQASDRMFLLVICSVISLIVVLVFGLAGWQGRRQALR